MNEANSKLSRHSTIPKGEHAASVRRETRRFCCPLCKGELFDYYLPVSRYGITVVGGKVFSALGTSMLATRRELEIIKILLTLYPGMLHFDNYEALITKELKGSGTHSLTVHISKLRSRMKHVDLGIRIVNGWGGYYAIEFSPLLMEKYYANAEHQKTLHP